MKHLKLILGTLALLFAIGFTSCNQNDPANATLFTGKYVGKATFLKVGEGAALVSSDDVTITVFKVGDKYSFRFSDDRIPALKGIEMKKGKETLVTIGTEATGSITITGDKLTIVAYTTKDGSWTATANRDK